MIWIQSLLAVSGRGWLVLSAVFTIAYAIGSIPWAYIIVRRLTGDDITAHGTGNVGAMNVRRTTGSWTWFVVAMVADALKGIVPVLAVRLLFSAGYPTDPMTLTIGSGTNSAAMFDLLMESAIAGAVLGHNYSCWLAIRNRRFERTGKGLATGGGALLAYHPIYFAVVLVVGLATIAISKYMMAGQVAAAVSLPVFAILARRPDWPFAIVMGVMVYAAHHRRFVGMLRGLEPKFYVNDRMGPRG